MKLLRISAISVNYIVKISISIEFYLYQKEFVPFKKKKMSKKTRNLEQFSPVHLIT